MEMLNPFAIAGLLGAGLYAGSYIALQLGRLDGNSVAFTLCNTLAAAMVLASLVDQFNTSTLLIQVMWLGVGIVGLIRRTLPTHANETRQSESASPRTTP